MGDQLCRACPKWRGGEILEFTAEEVQNFRIALLCLRLGVTPSQLLNEPYSIIAPMIELWEDPEVRRMANG